MKKAILPGLTLVTLFTVAAFYVFAQPNPPTRAGGQLADAIAQLNAGKPEQARELLAAIPESDPDHAAAQLYSALALSQLKDDLGLLKTLEASPIESANVPVEVKQDLACREIQALFKYRKFDDLLARAKAFEETHPGSPQAAMVTEHKLAALFERGMKKAQEASQMGDTNKFHARWNEAKANLEEFATLAAETRTASYSTVPKHALNEDLWVARMTLGDEKAALDSIPAQDAAAAERLSLLRVKLYQKLQPADVDNNLKLMTDFVEQFSESKGRRKVEFDMASLCYPRGKQLMAEAETMERAGNPNAANELRARSRQLFEKLRTIQSQLVADKEAGVEAWDLEDLREDMLSSYYTEKDYQSLATLSSAAVAGSERGSAKWMLGKLFYGIALRSQTPPKLDEASAAFDEVIETSFTGKPDHDHIVIAAAKWRISNALITGGTEKAKVIVKWVEGSDCVRNLKTDFVAAHAHLSDTTSTIQK